MKKKGTFSLLKHINNSNFRRTCLLGKIGSDSPVSKNSLLNPIDHSRHFRKNRLLANVGSSRHVCSGQFYSIIAMIISIPIILFISGTLVSVQKDRSGIVDKITGDQLHLVERSLEDDFVKGAQIPSKRAVLAMTNFVTINGTYFANSMAVFRESSLNGTILGIPSFLMVNNTITDWRNRVTNSSSFRVNMNFSTNITAYERDMVLGNFSLNITVREAFGRSRIERRVARNYSFSISGFEDPFFTLVSGGKVRRQYHVYGQRVYAQKFLGTLATGDFTGNVTFSGPPDMSKILVKDNINGENNWGCVIGNTGIPDSGQTCYVVGVQDPVNSIADSIQGLGGYSAIYVDNLTNSAWIIPVLPAIREGMYFSLDGPNVFERLQGRFNSSQPQFMTFVDTDRLQLEGIPVSDGDSKVDWIYFGGYGISGRRVRSFPSWFRVDDGYAARLNLTELLI